MAFQFQRVTALRPFLVLLGVVVVCGVAQAQLQLPGAFNPAPAGTVAPPADGAKPKKAGPKKPPPPPKVPADDAVIGRALKQNGYAGQIEFARSGKDLQIVKL